MENIKKVKPKSSKCRNCTRSYRIPMPEGQIDTCCTDITFARTSDKVEATNIVVTFVNRKGETETVGTDLFPINDLTAHCPFFRPKAPKPTKPIKDRTLICSVCGGSNVHMKNWFELNNPTSSLTDINDIENYWCSDCQDNVHVIFEDDFVKTVKIIDQ